MNRQTTSIEPILPGQGQPVEPATLTTLRVGLFVLACFFFLLPTVGCYQRTIAPELTYDESKVEILDKEIKKMDWEL